MPFIISFLLTTAGVSLLYLVTQFLKPPTWVTTLLTVVLIVAVVTAVMLTFDALPWHVPALSSVG